jgi:hypothetical protein
MMLAVLRCASALAKLTRVYVYMLRFLERLKKVLGCEKQPLLERPPAPPREGMPTTQAKWVSACLPKEWLLLEAAQKTLAS